MSISQSELSRSSLRTTPISNTEVNADRLPSPKALEGMELRCRGDDPAPSAKGTLLALGLFVVLGQSYAMCWRFARSAFDWLWSEAHAVEGMPVVAAMLGGIALGIAALSLVFVPNRFRRALVAISLPMVAVMASTWRGVDARESLCAAIAAFFAALFWKISLTEFHTSWLTADPRMSTVQAAAWKGRKRQRWILPPVSDAGKVLKRYLTYDAPSGIPGVWIAPSLLAARLSAFGFLAGCIFVVAGSTVVNSSFELVAILSLAESAIALLVVTVWAVGDACWLSSECEKQFRTDTRTPFERCFDRLRNSEHVSRDVITGAPIRESEHLLLGVEPWQKFPILLHQSILAEHLYIAGRTGSGKTSMGLMLLLIQLIRGHRAEAGKWSDKAPVVIVDLKGDRAMFQTAKAEAEARGQKFRFFTLEPGRASFHFNPFLAFKSGSLTLPQLVQSLLDACGLYYGDEYGKRYYSERHRNLLTKALQSSPSIDCFRKLYQRIKVLYDNNQKEYADGFELVSVVSGLTHYDQLITDAALERGDETIRLDRVLENREVVYFWLPTTKESVAANQIAKFVLFCLRAAASDRECEGKERRQAYLLIDEFQKVAGDNFQGILQQARSVGIAAILANQSLADLKRDTWDLTTTIRTNTRAKLFFSVTEPEEIEAFRELAGEEVQTFGMNDVEAIRLRLSAKDLASLSDHPKRLLLQVTSGSGYTQFGGLPIPVETDWPISKELSDQRAAMPWPSSPRVATPAPLPPKVSIKPPSPTAPAAPPPAAAPAIAPIAPSQPPTSPTPAQPSAPAVAPASTTAAPSTPRPAPMNKPVVPPASARPAKKQGPWAVPVPPKNKKPPKVPSTPQPPKAAPAPAVKAAFAKTIKNLMDE